MLIYDHVVDKNLNNFKSVMSPTFFRGILRPNSSGDQIRNKLTPSINLDNKNKEVELRKVQVITYCADKFGQYGRVKNEVLCVAT